MSFKITQGALLYILYISIRNSIGKKKFVDWDASKWILIGGMNESTVDFKEVCEPPEPQNLIFPGELRNMRDNVLLCMKMRGSISVIRNESTQSMMTAQFQNYQQQMGIHSESEWWHIRILTENEP